MADHGSTHYDQLRERLRNADGPRFWRSLEELADTPQFREQLAREFPAQAAVMESHTSRRQFLALAGASLALAGLGGCKGQPEEKIVPYVRQPEDIVPGKPLQYATAMVQSGLATGLLVESHQGRPTKIEGNPEHPASLGATDVFQQATVLSLYDPDRSQTVLNAGTISTWDAFLTATKPALDKHRNSAGRGLRILTETVTSPTLAAQLKSLLAALPEARWYQWEPLNRVQARRGAELAFGRAVNAVYDFTQADVVVSLDDDFLAAGPGHLRYSREFFQRREVVAGPTKQANRLYVAEVTPTLTGAKADHRVALRVHELEALMWELARRLGVSLKEDAAAELPVPDAWIDAVVDDLQKASSAGRGSLVLAGQYQSAEVHAAAHAINAKLGNVGKSVRYTEPVEAESVDQSAALAELVDEMRQGQVESLFVLGGNPVYSVPSDLKFAEALNKVSLSVQLGAEADETAALVNWHIPEAHFLESWSDARAFDGTVSIVQPLIQPLYDGRTTHELISVIADQPGAKPHDIVHKHWQAERGLDDKATAAEKQQFEDWWQTCLHDGIVPDTQLPAIEVTSVESLEWELPSEPESKDFDLVFRPDPTLGDGRFANNGWLQELPKSLTLLTWDNAAVISPRTADEYKIDYVGDELKKDRQYIELDLDGAVVRIPVWVLPGQPDRTITLHLGGGRRNIGRVGRGRGFDVNPLRSSKSPWLSEGASLRVRNDRFPLASTQAHSNMEGRHLVRHGTLEEFTHHPDHPDFMTAGHHADPLSFYPEVEYEGYKWGMSINLTSCIGCNACTIACQAENNIPVVGKEEVQNGREMHWIRVDRYFSGEDLDLPNTHFQPVPCMHCELAPCEVVCPVAATTHSPEGINEMTYNRCVGTRYCANNCPYKVRRFNFLHYTKPVEETPVLQLVQNPDVTVRTLGVMEKCSYCVQRINQGRIDAEKEDREIKDGEVITACQQACPTQAIVFGDMNDPQSAISKAKESKLNYGLLDELNTRPRTTYVAEINNPHPSLSGKPE